MWGQLSHKGQTNSPAVVSSKGRADISGQVRGSSGWPSNFSTHGSYDPLISMHMVLMTHANMGHGQNTDPSCSSGPYNTMAPDDSSGHLNRHDPGRSTHLLDTSMATGCSLDPRTLCGFGGSLGHRHQHLHRPRHGPKLHPGSHVSMVPGGITAHPDWNGPWQQPKTGSIPKISPILSKELAVSAGLVG